MLGVPLDKSEQCSAWHKRPLSCEQLAYAANDAAVLLALLDALTANASPSKFPFQPAKAPAQLEQQLAPPPEGDSPDSNGNAAAGRQDGDHGVQKDLGNGMLPVAPASESTDMTVAEAAKEVADVAGAEYEHSAAVVVVSEKGESGEKLSAPVDGGCRGHGDSTSAKDSGDASLRIPTKTNKSGTHAHRHQAGVVGVAAWAEEGRAGDSGIAEQSESGRQGLLGFGGSKTRITGPSTSGPVPFPPLQSQHLDKAEMPLSRLGSSPRSVRMVCLALPASQSNDPSLGLEAHDLT